MFSDYFASRGQSAAEETGRATSTAVAGADVGAGGAVFGGAAPPQTHPCTRCDAWNAPASLALLLLLFLVSTVLTMYKVLRSYSKKAERKQEVSRATDRNGHVSSGNYYDEGHHYKGQNGHAANGQLLAVDNRHLNNAYAGQAFSESSSYETREHFERKVQRVKKTRGERERSRSSRRGEEVSESLHASDASSARDALLQWARKVTSGYPRVNVTNFSSSWKDGLAFNAILHRYRPNLIDWNKVSDSSVSNRERLENAFAAAEREFGVDRLLDAQDVDTDHPDEKSIITYVSSLYNALPHLPELSKFITMQEQYIVEARAWMELVERATTLIDNETLFMQQSSSQRSESLSEFEKYHSESMATRAREYDRLMERYEVLRRHLSGTDHFCIPRNLTEHALTEAWSNLTYLNDHKLASLHQKIIQVIPLQSNLSDLISRLSRGIGITNEKLDLILNRIEEVESRVDTARPGEIERTVNEIVDDLNALEPPIGGFFDDVEELKSQNHPEANDFYRQVYGLHQRRTAYLDRLTNQLLVRLGVRTETLRKENASRLESIRTSSFNRVQECIEWVRVRLEKLSEMEFLEDLETLEEMFEQHKLDNRDIQDFRQNVDECIARQAEVSAEDTYEYCELLRVLESEYQQLRDLSAGRMLDLDSLIAFVRAAQMELVWVSEREEIEVTRNWSDVKQLDLPMLTNYYKQLLHEMELREKQYNDVHNQGAALLNQGHPAVHVIEVYLRTMQNQWDWLLALSKCLEEHLRDALNLKSFTEEAADAEAWMEEQAIRLENNYNRTDFDLEEGERLLRELDEMKEILNKYHSVLMALTERCATISPLWQRGERISRPIAVTALCDYSDKNVHIKAGDEVVLLDNSDLIKWHIRDLAGSEGTVPSVVFRIPPPDPKLTGYLNRLLQQFEKLKKLWEKKHRMVRFNMVLNTMKTIQGWDLDTFNAIDPEQRDAIMRALNDDANKLLAEMDPNDPLALRLKEELRRTNEHFWDLLNASQKPPEPDHSNLFDGQIGDLLRKLEEAWRKLNDNTGKPISRSPEELENVIMNHKSFEDALQGLDADVANVKELFRQLPNPTPTQRVNNDRLSTLWEDLWDLSRMYVERIKVLESVLNGILEVSDIVKAHEITLNSFDDLPAALDKLRGHHSQLLEMNMVLQQQQSVIDSLNKNVALLRQHVARTRIGQSSHPDVDRLEDEVQQLNVRWENVCAQVADRLKAAERALQTQMVYRSEYENEMAWLDRVEETINKLRKPEDLRPEQYQQQLDILVAEYAQLQERTEAIENVNREGGKFIREAKGYDSRMGQFHDSIVGIHGPAIKQEFRRTKPQPKNGAQIVTEELEALNRRFAQLSSLILERRNTMQVLIQNWKRQKQEEEEMRKADEEAKRRAFEAARLKALEDADRLRKEREAAEAARRAAEEAERARRMAAELERARLAAEEARRREEEERKRKEDEERRRREDEERRRREDEDRRRREREREDEERRRREREKEDEDRRRREEEERRRREEDERRRRQREKDDEDRRRREEEERRRREQEEEEKRRKKMPPLNIVQGSQIHEVVGQENPDEFEVIGDLPGVAKITEHEDEMQMYQEETVTKTQFYEMEGTLHKQTGEILTFVEAVRQGLLDLSAGGGQFFDIHSGRISLEKAVELGYIDGAFNDVLNTRYGIRHPETGADLTLLEAIQIGLYDPQTRHLYDIHTGEMLDLYDWVAHKIVTMDTQRRLVKMGILKLPPMALHSAIDQGVLNTVSGHFVGKYSHESMPIRDALYHGYLQLVSPQQIPMIAITLSDAIKQGFINANNGEFVDKNTKDTFTLREACSKQFGLLNLYVPEIVNTADNTRLNLKDAMLRNAINTRNGNFTDLQTRRTLSLREAFQEDLISKPYSLTEMFERDLIDSTNHFIDRGTKHRHTILEAIAAGLLDAEVRHIVDPDEKDVISIAEAMERGILSADGKIILEKQQKEFTIPEAVREGLLSKRVRHSIFDVRGIQNTRTGQTMSFNEACEAGAIIPNAERVVDLATQESYLISDQKATTIIDQTLHELFIKPLGIRGDRGDYDLNLVRAVSKGIVDHTKAVFFNKSTKHEMTPREAYDAGLVSLRGAIQAAALFDVSPSLIAPVKKVEHKKRVSRPGQPGIELASDQVKVTLAEAMKQGLIDSRNQRFRQGDIDMSLDDALNQGLIDPSSEWIVPSKSNGVGPTIEEKTTESVTETGQQLAPKYYPDKNIEESVTTVKRVRTTETTALGGPGGVSVYRAITGGKGAMEVPGNGYHLYEAERKGIIDLTTGNITSPNVDRAITFADGIELGIIDASSISVKDPKSGRMVNVKEALEKKIMEEDGSVTHHGRSLNIEKAVEAGVIVIDAEPVVPASGVPKNVIHIPSGGGPVISFRPVGVPVVEESEQSWSFDSTKGVLVDHMSGERLPLERALLAGKIQPEDLAVRDALTGREMSFTEAEKWGIIDKRGYYLDKIDNKRLSFTEAAQQHRIYPTGGVLDNAGDAIHTSVKVQTRTQVAKKQATSTGAPQVDNTLGRALSLGWYNAKDGMFTHPDTHRQMTLKEAIIKGLFNPYDTSVVDKKNNKKISLLEAIQEGIVDDTAGTVLDTVTQKKHDLNSALELGILEGKSFGDSLESGLFSGRLDLATGKCRQERSLGWYNAKDGMFTHPDTHRQMTLKEAIIKGLFNPYDTSVVDKKNNKKISLLEAIQEGIVDDTAGTVLDTVTQKKHDLNSALELGILEGKSFGDSLESGLFSGRLDLATGSYTQPSGASLPLHEALKKNLVDQSSIVVRDPASGTEYTYHEAVSRRIVDPERGLIHNQQTNEATSFPQALTTGLIAGAGSATRPSHSAHKIVEQKLQLTPFAPQQVVHRRNGDDRHEYVDLGGGKQVMVKVVRGEGGVEKGEYVDPSTGMKFTIQMHGDPFVTETKTTVKSTSQVQSVELEPHAEFVGIDRIRDKRNGRTMSLEDAKRIGLARVDKKGKQMTKTYSVFRSNIQNALNNGVLDAHMEKISLEDAIRAGIIDIRELSYRNPKSGESIPLTQAANMGLVDVTLAETLPKGVCNPTNNERIPIKRAIEMGIIDARTGEVRDPHTRKRLTWLDIIKSVYQAITSDGVFDPTKGQRVPVTHALNEGLIDPKTGKYHNPITEEDIELKDAVDRGLIDSGTYDALTKPFLEDYRTNRRLNLVEAVDAKLVDPKNKTIQVSRHSIVPIAKAVEDGRIPREIGEKLRQIDKLNFAEALGKGLIDVTSNIFTDQDTGRQMTIAQAIEQGYIDTGNVEAMEGSDEKNLSNIINSEEFDENSGRIRDKRTSLHLTFKDAVERDVIDGDSLLHDLESGQTLTLREALVRRKIDSDGKYIAGNLKMTLRDAVKGGLIALIASPMQAAQAVAEAVKRRDAEGYKFKIENYGGESRGSRTSVPKFREETIVRLTPQKAEPSLTVRMRHSQTNIGDRARSIIDDPSTLADLQHEFLANLEANRFDTDEKIITNPSGGQRLSVREAAETGLLDVLTGEIVVPDTGRRYSIPKAVHLNYVQGEAAKRLMESLNMSIEELNLAQQQSAPSPGVTEGGSSTRTWTKTVNWHGQPSELRKSKTDPLAPYTTYSSSIAERTQDAPSWAR
ncbi:unnamed protein product [Haemonchus placei]|uniref:Calponin-homology (CH) domain-containing protein n=1 Tax=Haemonchus placei TaxID=6290 RepID=A0A158QQN4_HAEPC|nr:unnamed protein product [Haemonchus placei]